MHTWALSIMQKSARTLGQVKLSHSDVDRGSAELIYMRENAGGCSLYGVSNSSSYVVQYKVQSAGQKL